MKMNLSLIKYAIIFSVLISGILYIKKGLLDPYVEKKVDKATEPLKVIMKRDSTTIVTLDKAYIELNQKYLSETDSLGKAIQVNEQMIGQLQKLSLSLKKQNEKLTKQCPVDTVKIYYNWSNKERKREYIKGS
jgi:hypothetical protein